MIAAAAAGFMARAAHLGSEQPLMRECRHPASPCRPRAGPHLCQPRGGQSAARLRQRCGLAAGMETAAAWPGWEQHTGVHNGGQLSQASRSMRTSAPVCSLAPQPPASAVQRDFGIFIANLFDTGQVRAACLVALFWLRWSSPHAGC